PQPDRGHAAAPEPYRRQRPRPAARTCPGSGPGRSGGGGQMSGARDRSPAERARELRALIEHHNRQYHTLDSPEISDQDFDALFAELLQLEDEHPELRTPDPPTQRVGGPVSERFAQVVHEEPMLSLANARSEEELLAWEARLTN